MVGLDDRIASLSDSGSVLVVLLVALLLGLRHATDPDHIAAVTTLVASTRERAAQRAAQLGAWWGLGHALTLIVFGVPIVLFERHLPAALQRGTETAVAALIVFLSGRLLIRARSGYFHAHAHAHPPHEHDHRHAVRHPPRCVHDRARARPRWRRRRPCPAAGGDAVAPARGRVSGRARRLHRRLHDDADDGLRKRAGAPARARRPRSPRASARRREPRVRALVRGARVGARAVPVLAAARDTSVTHSWRFRHGAWHRPWLSETCRLKAATAFCGF